MNSLYILIEITSFPNTLRSRKKMASGTESDSEFDGFNDEGVRVAIESDNKTQQRVQEELDDESDIEIPDVFRHRK
jgi:hypothetical protein